MSQWNILGVISCESNEIARTDGRGRAAVNGGHEEVGVGCDASGSKCGGHYGKHCTTMKRDDLSAILLVCTEYVVFAIILL